MLLWRWPEVPYERGRPQDSALRGLRTGRCGRMVALAIRTGDEQAVFEVEGTEEA
jgi:hypothetical protein